MPMNNTCDRCNATDIGIDWFAKAYRAKELKHGRADPGNLCGKCAGSDTGKRIGDEDFAKQNRRFTQSAND